MDLLELWLYSFTYSESCCILLRIVRIVSSVRTTFLYELVSHESVVARKELQSCTLKAYAAAISLLYQALLYRTDAHTAMLSRVHT